MVGILHDNLYLFIHRNLVMLGFSSGWGDSENCDVRRAWMLSHQKQVSSFLQFLTMWPFSIQDDI